MSLQFLIPHGRFGRWLMIAISFAFLAALAACGGGEEQATASAAPPKVEVLGFTEMGYAKVRLSFHRDGFSLPVAAGDEIVWHSGMIHADQASAPRAKVQQTADGTMFADILLYYTTDRGIFAAVTAGQSVVMTQGQPANSMVVTAWQLPSALKAAPLGDGTGRTWIDVKF